MTLNRKARRLSVTLDQFQQRLKHVSGNGVDFQALTTTAHSILMGNLKRYGNDPSSDHEEALLALCGTYAKMVTGNMRGRIPISLDTGMGKTESIVAFCSALNRLGYTHIALMVCQSKVEGLCELKRKLVNQEDIPADRVGLIHSKRYDPARLDENGRLIGDDDSFASLPSDDHQGEYQIILVTHNRIRGKTDLGHFNRYRGNKRNLVIWDEALIVADVMHIKERDLRADFAGWRERSRGIHGADLVADYFAECLRLIDHELDKQKNGFPAHAVPMPILDDDQITLMQQIIKKSGRPEEQETLLDFMGLQSLGVAIRAVTTREGHGVIQYQIVIPPELQRVVVLDASYPIRLLEHYDQNFTLQDAATSRIKPGLKRYDKVVIKQMMFNSGRHSITKKENRGWIAKEIAQVVKTIPEDEGVIIFTFKARKDYDPYKTMKDALVAEGIDPEAKVLASVNGGLKEVPRINILTWGMETSLNEYAYSKHVILGGILRRSLVDLAGAIVGQKDNLTEPVTSDELEKVMLSELTHLAFQAFGRGSCRMVQQGFAQPMTGYLIHPSTNIQTELSKVMVGVGWEQWVPADEKTYKEKRTKGLVSDLTMKIRVFLAGLPESVQEISSRKLKEELQITEDRSFRLARDAALDQLQGWHLQGRSLVRDLGLFN